MPAQKRTSKEKPSVETVKESFKVSDLLRVEVCNPIKAQIDKIKVCVPHIVECVPTRICKPIFLCKPDIFCKPDIICYPIVGPKICVPSAYQWPEEFPGEMREVIEELKTIKAEIEILKKAIK